MRDTVRINVRGRPPLKQCGLLCLAVGWWIETEVLVCLSGRYASARRPLQKSILHQERLVDFLEGSDVLANGCSNRAHADGPALELFDDGLEDARVHIVEAKLIYFEELERVSRDPACDVAAGADLGEIADPPEQAVRDARRAA